MFKVFFNTPTYNFSKVKIYVFIYVNFLEGADFYAYLYAKSFRKKTF